jgi:uncharacterized RDD family membrane protein YckC
MKCPKCAYLGFDSGARCRNCGYDFSLMSDPEPAAGLSLRADDAATTSSAWNGVVDQGRTESAGPALAASAIAVAPPAAQPGAAAPALHFEPTLPPPSFRGEPALPLFGASAGDSDEPLIKVPSAPRAPLSVRRTPDTPRLRAMPKAIERTAEPQLNLLEEAAPASAAAARPLPVSPESLASSDPGRRLLAAAIDHGILFAIDAIVLYLTLRISQLTMSEWTALSILPMVTFLGLVKLSYFTAFTCVGGQTIGKMAAHIRVVSDDHRPIDAALAVHRALAGAVSFLILGAGFIPALFGADRRALHDRLAHTRVVTLPPA